MEVQLPLFILAYQRFELGMILYEIWNV